MHNGNGHHKVDLSLPMLGLGLAAGWLLRKALQQQYEKVNGREEHIGEREMLESVFGEYSQRARDTLQDARDEVTDRLDELKTSLKEIDADEYKELVKEAVQSVGERGRLDRGVVSRLERRLLDDFRRVRQGAEKAEKATRPARRKVAANK